MSEATTADPGAPASRPPPVRASRFLPPSGVRVPGLTSLPRRAPPTTRAWADRTGGAPTVRLYGVRVPAGTLRVPCDAPQIAPGSPARMSPRHPVSRGRRRLSPTPPARRPPPPSRGRGASRPARAKARPRPARSRPRRPARHRARRPPVRTLRTAEPGSARAGPRGCRATSAASPGVSWGGGPRPPPPRSPGTCGGGSRLVTLTGPGAGSASRGWRSLTRSLSASCRNGSRTGWAGRPSRLRRPGRRPRPGEALGLRTRASARPRGARSTTCAAARRSSSSTGSSRWRGSAPSRAPPAAPRTGAARAGRGRRPLGLDGREGNLVVPPLTEADAVALFAERGRGTWRRVPPPRGASARRRSSSAGGWTACRWRWSWRRGDSARSTVAQVFERLDDRFRLLTGGPRRAPAPPDDAAGDRLEPRALHRGRAVAVGAAVGVRRRLRPGGGGVRLFGPELPAQKVRGVLGELVGAVRGDAGRGPAGGRFRMLDTVRAYGAAWLAMTDDDARLRRRHRDWYVGLATACELDWFGPRQDEVAARVEVEMPNLRLAMENCPEYAAEAYLGQYLAGTLWFYWVGCGRLAEGRHWLARGSRPRSPRRRAPEGTVGGRLRGDGPGGRMARSPPCRSAARRRSCERERRAAAYALHRPGAWHCSRTTCRARSGCCGRRWPITGARRAQQQRADGRRSSWRWRCRSRDELRRRAAVRGGARNLRGPRRALDARRTRCTSSAFAAWPAGTGERARRCCGEALTIDHAFHDLVGAVLAVELLALVRRWPPGTRRRRRCSRGPRSGSGPRWACRCSGRLLRRPAPAVRGAATAAAGRGGYEECGGGSPGWTGPDGGAGAERRPGGRRRRELRRVRQGCRRRVARITAGGRSGGAAARG